MTLNRIDRSTPLTETNWFIILRTRKSLRPNLIFKKLQLSGSRIATIANRKNWQVIRNAYLPLFGGEQWKAANSQNDKPIQNRIQFMIVSFPFHLAPTALVELFCKHIYSISIPLIQSALPKKNLKNNYKNSILKTIHTFQPNEIHTKKQKTWNQEVYLPK